MKTEERQLDDTGKPSLTHSVTHSHQDILARNLAMIWKLQRAECRVIVTLVAMVVALRCGMPASWAVITVWLLLVASIGATR